MPSHSQLNILEIILDSGPVVKFVLLLLIVCSVVSWGIILYKRKISKAVVKNNKKFFDLYRSADNLKEVNTACDALPFSPYKLMFKSGYEELQKFQETVVGDENASARIREHFQAFGLTGIERGLRIGANESNHVLDKYLSTLASISTVSPFIGLFGTVWGIINSFSGLASGGGTLDAVAPGIAEALVATAVGLAAAIPASWFFNYFANENLKLNSDMENFEQDFLNLVERSLI